MGKGEIAHYEQFLLFPQCIQKACFPGASKGVIVWEWVKPNDKLLDETKLRAFADDNSKVATITISLFDRIEKHSGKRRKCWLPAFSSFPTVFSNGFFVRVDKGQDRVVMI